ncbi:transglycosylase SLT domain-containing protein [Coralloluteibacterium thermophilus]|uniref:Transglycosylase SLT domain-containing protein n=1 Tax=Coralloluteibacterium thermophilum TaxID=2707049 RepID=A0ABV9NF73_9GAMM
MSWRRPRRFALVGAIALALAACQTPPRGGAPAAEEPSEVASLRVVARPSAPPRPPRVPVLRVSEAEPVTGGEVLDRLTARLSTPACVRGSHNETWRRRYAGHPARFSQRVEAILPLLNYVLEEVENTDLPGEFALIPLVESWYRPDAVGAGGSNAPGGLWQMIPGTARNHGIAIMPGYDGRYSPIDATHAALSYLDALHAEFGDWRATAMAYNAGEGRMRRALAAGDGRVHGERRKPAGLASHTYAYIDKLRALSCLLAHPERHGLRLPRDTVVDPLRRISLAGGAQDLGAVADVLEMPVEELRRLNPAYTGTRVSADAPHVLLVPERTQPRWAALADLDPGARVAATRPTPAEPGAAATATAGAAYTVKRGDTLSAIARSHGLRVADLLRWNQLTQASILRPGQEIRLAPQ